MELENAQKPTNTEPIVKRKGLITRFVTHGPTIAISGVVAWLVSVYFESENARISQSHYVLELEKDKVQIISLVKDQETTLALALIDYYQTRFGNKDTAYTTLLESISAYIDTAQGKISGKNNGEDSSVKVENITDSITPDSIRDQFFSANRRKYAEYLVSLYRNASDKDKNTLIHLLLDAIIAKDKDGLRRYRINLYIALTFSLLPDTRMSENDKGRLSSLREYDEYKDNKTFKLNVDNAIAKQK